MSRRSGGLLAFLLVFGIKNFMPKESIKYIRLYLDVCVFGYICIHL